MSSVLKPQLKWALAMNFEIKWQTNVCVLLVELALAVLSPQQVNAGAGARAGPSWTPLATTAHGAIRCTQPAGTRPFA